MTAAAIVMAAGSGTRMRSDLPKVLHPAAGRPLLVHVLDALAGVSLEQRIVVTSAATEPITRAVEESGIDGVEYATQDRARGTADAVRAGLGSLREACDVVLVVPGDSPLLEPETLRSLLEVHRVETPSATILTARVSDPTGYGRVLRDEQGDIEAIVEEKDATFEQRALDEVNAGAYVFDVDELRDCLGKVDTENAQGEYYLTDVISLLRSQGKAVASFRSNENEVLGVNSRAQLARAAGLLRRRACERWMEQGVTIVDPRTTHIDSSVRIGRDAVIHPFTFLEGATVIEERAEVGPQTRVLDSHVGAGATVTFAVVVGSSIGEEASVGPFASLRKGTRLGAKGRIGTFVETKQSTLGEASKANHLAYLGDAEIGRGVNVGAGTITCNWDGTEKHGTVVEDDVYIGSDTMLVAPTHLKERSATGAGAVVKGEVPEGSLAVGMPARIIEGKGDRMRRAERENDKESS